MSILLQSAFAQPLLPSFFPTADYHPSADSLLWCLKSYHTDTVHNIYHSYFSPKKNVTDNIKQKLLSLLKNEWTKEEIEPRIKIKFKESFEFSYFEGILNTSIFVSKREFFGRFNLFFSKSRIDTSNTLSKNYYLIYDSVYKAIYDSTANVYRKNIESGLRSLLFHVPDEIVLSVGTAEIKEAIPILKHDLASPRHAYDTGVAQLALLRLGDTTYKKKYIDLHKKYVDKDVWNTEDIRRDVKAMQAIHTQESIEMLVDWIDTSKNYKSEYEPGMDKSTIPLEYYSAFVVLRLLSILENKDFRLGFRKLPLKPRPFDDYSMPRCITVDQMLYTKQWMLANKGKYEFE